MWSLRVGISNIRAEGSSRTCWRQLASRALRPLLMSVASSLRRLMMMAPPAMLLNNGSVPWPKPLQDTPPAVQMLPVRHQRPGPEASSPSTITCAKAVAGALL
jgi:hypothetical protein